MSGIFSCVVWALDPYRRIQSIPASISFTDSFEYGLIINASRLRYNSQLFDNYNLFVDGNITQLPNIASLVQPFLPRQINGQTIITHVKLMGFSQGSVVVFSKVYATPQLQINDEATSASFEESIKKSLKAAIKDLVSNASGTYYRTWTTQLGVTADDVLLRSDGRSRDSLELCAATGQPLVTRGCDFTLGRVRGIFANWERLPSRLNCTGNIPRSPVTDQLEDLAQVSPEFVEQNASAYANAGANLTSHPEQLEFPDLVFASQILENLAAAQNALKTPTVLNNMVQTVDNMMGADLTRIREAQEIGSSGSRTKNAMENFVRSVELPGGTREKEVVLPKVALKVLDLIEDNMLAGFQVKEDSKGLFSPGSIETLSMEGDLMVDTASSAVLLPRSVLDKAQELETGGGARASAIVYKDDRLFRRVDDVQPYSADSNVLSVQIGRNGSAISDFESAGITASVQLFFDSQSKRAKHGVCGFWNFTLRLNNSRQQGGWDTSGCASRGTRDGRVICECRHLTNFALLLDVTGSTDDTGVHQEILGIITKVGLSISIVALLCAIISFAVIPQLRQNLSSRILFNLCLSLLLADLVFLIGVERTEYWEACAFIAALLQYLLLVMFSWMLIEAVHHYLRFVRVLGTYIPRFMLKSALPAWLIPLVPVVAVVAYDHELFVRPSFCWLQTKGVLYFFFPFVLAVLLSNIVLFVLILRGITNRPKLKSNQDEKKLALMQIKASIATLSLLGLTWIFGFLAIDLASLPMQYIFSILNSFQGLVIFVLHIAREKRVQRHWMRICMPKRYRREQYSKTKSTSNTTSGARSPTTAKSTTLPVANFQASSSSNDTSKESKPSTLPTNLIKPPVILSTPVKKKKPESSMVNGHNPEQQTSNATKSEQPTWNPSPSDDIYDNLNFKKAASSNELYDNVVFKKAMSQK